MTWRNGAPRSRAGFTLIELLVVVAVIAILISILLPSLSAAREQAKKAKCLANLSQFGRGFFTYATDNRDVFTSGQTDAQLAGTNYPASIVDWEIVGLHKVGWVADLVNNKLGFPGKMLCPSAPGRITQSWKRNRIAIPILPQTGPAFDQRVKQYVDQGYNTNYCQSWLMAHTAPSQSSVAVDKDRAFVGEERVDQGTLRSSVIGTAGAARVPLLADARNDPDDYTAGVRATKSATDGPQWHYGSTGVRSVADYRPNQRWGAQDWDDFGVNHVKKLGYNADQHPYTTGNILFADGHASGFVDVFRIDGSGVASRRPDGQLDSADLESKVFDGVLLLGRRSRSASVLQ